MPDRRPHSSQFADLFRIESMIRDLMAAQQSAAHSRFCAVTEISGVSSLSPPRRAACSSPSWSPCGQADSWSSVSASTAAPLLLEEAAPEEKQICHPSAFRILSFCRASSAEPSRVGGLSPRGRERPACAGTKELSIARLDSAYPSSHSRVDD